jgi:dihydrofolate reductase
MKPSATDWRRCFAIVPMHLRGILNGVDNALWNPATDPALVAPYAANRLAAKRENKRALQSEMGLDAAVDRPLFGIISRLTEQKGLDLVLTLGEGITHLPAQLAILGSGDKTMEAGFRQLAERHPGQIAFKHGFDEALAHRIEAGADSFLMPSRFEPCGLNQMYSLRYGTPPIVRATGGLADTVVDVSAATLADKTANGFVIDEATPHALWLALERATRCWHDRKLWQSHPAKRHASGFFLGPCRRAIYCLVPRRHRRPPLKAQMSEIIIIAAVAANRVIGRDNQLIWNIPEDMAHFKTLTQGHTVLMGRKTWESLPPRFRPLPGRRNIVITRQPDFVAPGAELANSLEAGLGLAASDALVFIIGGAEIYQQAMALANRLEITEVALTPEGDSWFPEIAATTETTAGPRVNWEKTAKITPPSQTGTGFSFVTYRRKQDLAKR